jgi:hypothetical protein
MRRCNSHALPDVSASRVRRHPFLGAPVLFAVLLPSSPR